LGAFYQRTEMDGSPEVVLAPGLSGLQNDLLPGLFGDGIETTLKGYSALVRASLGKVDLTSITAYDENNFRPGYDLSTAFKTFVQDFGVGGAAYLANLPEKMFSQEVRLSGSFGHTLDWLVGGFYKRDRTHVTFSYLAVDEKTGKAVGSLA